MSEEKKATTRHFLWALTAAFVIGCIGSVIRYILPMPLAGDLCSVILFCILAYVVLVHYTSVFTYEISGYTLTLTRRIGAREKRIEIKKNAVSSVGKAKALQTKTGKATRMCVSVMPHKNDVYITYREDGQLKTVCIEPDDAFTEELLRVFGKSK